VADVEAQISIECIILNTYLDDNKYSLKKNKGNGIYKIEILDYITFLYSLRQMLNNESFKYWKYEKENLFQKFTRKYFQL